MNPITRNYSIDNFNDDKLIISPIRTKKTFQIVQKDGVYTDMLGLENDDDFDNDEYIGFDENSPFELLNKSSKFEKDDRKTELERNNEQFRTSLSNWSNQEYKEKIQNEEKYKAVLEKAFDSVYPLFYFDTEQRQYLLDNITYNTFTKETLLYSGIDDEGKQKDNYSCFILLNGEIHIYSNKKTFLDLITDITLFGYDGPILEQRISTVIVEKDSVIAEINQDDFMKLLRPFSQFATYISRNFRHKDKIFDSWNSFRNYVVSFIDKGPINIKKMLKLYKKFKPCLHPKCNSEDFDANAFIYSLNRLPENVIQNYVYVIINKPPRLLSLNKGWNKTLWPKQITAARNRDVFKCWDGKSWILVRDWETDVLDFISNLCIYLIESTKIRKHIYSPMTVPKWENARGNKKKTFDILRESNIKINEKDAYHMFDVLGEDFTEKLIEWCINYQDISVSIDKSRLSDKDSIELWTQNLWNTTKRILGCSSWWTKIDDLVVDIYQGSRRTLINCINPHLYLHQKEILEWGLKEKIQLHTKVFLSEYDRVIAYSYYYYLHFPEKEKEWREMNKRFGIEIVEKTFGTGVHVIVINVNKLTQQLKAEDLKIPGWNVKPASNNHIILHIGYTFGYQSHDIIKPVLMLFGPKLRSWNIIGRCGGLIGKQGDIMIAKRHFLDKTHEVVSAHNGIVDKEKIKEITKTDVHIGPFLTVAGTILQNDLLLNYYRAVIGCIGLDMEGYYYVREVENSIKHNWLSNDFILRCIYYVLDVPTDPNQSRTNEKVEDCWEEGIGAVNAIERYLLQEAFN